MAISEMARTTGANRLKWRIMSRPLTFGTRMPCAGPILTMRVLA
jgi:hypothetical protein